MSGVQVPVRREVMHLEVSLAKAFQRGLDVSVVHADVFHQLVERQVRAQYFRVSGEEQLLAGTGNGYVQLAVDGIVSFAEGIGGEEVQLVEVAHRKRVDNHVPLASLIAFHRIDGNRLQLRYAEPGHFLAYHGYLVPVGHDDPHGLMGIEFGPCEPVDAFQQYGYDAGFVRVGLVRTGGVVGSLRGDEDHAPLQHQLVEVVFRLDGAVRKRFFLVRKGHGFQPLLRVKGVVGELGDGRVHAPLLAEHAPELRRALPVQAFEKRVAAIRQPDSEQERVGHPGFCLVLLGYGGQLFVIAYQYELVNRVSRCVLCREDADKVGLQYLGGFVDNRGLKVLHAEQVQTSVEGAGGSCEDAGAGDAGTDVAQLGTIRQAVLQQVGDETLVACHFVPDADKRVAFGDARLCQHVADFVYRTVGVGQQQKGGLRVGQGFFYHVAQGARGLSRSRRAYQQEIVFALLFLQDELVEPSVLSVQLARGVSFRRALV